MSHPKQVHSEVQKQRGQGSIAVLGRGGPSSLRAGKQAWILASEETLPPHPATDFRHHEGIGWEGGINQINLWPTCTNAKGQRKSETKRSVWTEGFLVEVTCELSHEGWNGII